MHDKEALNNSSHVKLPTKQNFFLPTVICLLAALFYLYEFILQVSPSVMTTQLMADLGLNAASLGMMSACYYYAYAPMQIPAGLLYDHYGPRLLLTVAIIVCAAGALLFGLAQTLFVAGAGRFLMGIGSAFSFIGALILVSRWFPAKYFALLAGIVQLMSSIGAMTGEKPLADVVNQVGWRHSIVGLAVIGVLIALAIWLVVRDRPPGIAVTHTTSHPGEMRRLRTVMTSRPHWLTALYSFTTWAPITAFAALWGVPYLVAEYNVSTATASGACALMWLGIGLGSPFIGWWSDHIKRRCLPLTLCSILALVMSVLILYVPNIPWSYMYGLLFLFGLSASSQALTFGLIKDISHPKILGTAIGFNNMAVVITGAVLQPLIGYILHQLWSGQYVNGVPFYQATDYRWALLVLPFCSLLGILLSTFCLPETHCQVQMGEHKLPG